MHVSDLRVMNVSPHLAEEWLKRNPRNRPLNKARVAQMASDMKNGRWLMTGASIQFDDGDNLIDGQHRLSGVVVAGVTVPMIVVRGLNPRAQAVIDIGQKRTMGQELGLQGVHNANHVAAISSIHWRMRNSAQSSWGSTNGPTRPELAEWTHSRADLYQAAVVMGRAAREHAGLRVSVYGCLYALVSDANRLDAWHGFHQGIVTGANLSLGDPRLTLRNRGLATMQERSSAGMWQTQIWLAYCIKSFNAYTEGRSLKMLRFSAEELPIPQIS